MKKLLFTLLVLIASLPLLAQEAAPVSAEELNAPGYHPYDTTQNVVVSKRYANWSLIPHFGFNIFDGDFNRERKHPVSFPSAGLDFEYAFTPVFALGVEYMYSHYGTRGVEGEADTLLLGNMHRPSLYLSADLIGLFYPHDKRKIFSLNAILGGGYGFYKTDIMYSDKESKSGTKSRTPESMKKYEGTAFFRFGANFEFNLNRTLALGLRAEYDYFMTDQIDGRGYAGAGGQTSKNNDGIVDVTLNLRIKLTAQEHSHVRNMGGSEPNIDIAKRLSEIEQIANDAAAAAEEAKVANKEAKKANDAIAAAPAGELIGRPRDTVIIYRDTVIIREVPVLPSDAAAAGAAPAAAPAYRPADAPAAAAYAQNYYIYFQPAKADIDNDGLATIQQVADVLEANPSLYAVVTAYCDNTGSDDYNFALGDRRAGNVIDELSEEYGVPASRLYSTGVGKIVGKRSSAAYGPNRRAVIRLVDEPTFRRMTSDLDQRRNQRKAVPQVKPAETAAPSEAQPAKAEPVADYVGPVVEPAVVSPYALRPGNTVTIGPNTSLVTIAREQYGNGNCWVYIYLANNKIVNPNVLRSGKTVHVPELTDEEKAISASDSKRLFNENKR